jgi:hypothetical protein
VLAEKSTFFSVAVWFPNLVFGILAIFYYEMQNDNLKSYLNLHCFFIWGFTAILGALITITADTMFGTECFFAAVF